QMFPVDIMLSEDAEVGVQIFRDAKAVVMDMTDNPDFDLQEDFDSDSNVLLDNEEYEASIRSDSD
ncbi:UNVERIFIED_CONTAM: hypothetical protein HDU68_006195, partial [Siphonaria sp. JEL0065]